MTGKLTFGILCNSTTLQRWQANALKELIGHPAFEAKLVIINDNPAEKQPRYKKLFSKTLLFTQYETRILKINAKQPEDISGLLSDVKTIRVKTTKKGKYSHYFAPDDIDNIKACGLDFIIRFGFGIIKGDILNAAKHGVWSYHHGDENEFRGGPPGFWELYYNKPITSAILQRLTPTLDGGMVLKKGNFKTIHHSYAEQVDTLFAHTSGWIKQVGLQILNGTPHTYEANTKGNINKAPKNGAFLLFLWVLFKNKVVFKFNALFRVELWNIGKLNNSLQDVLENKQLNIKWLPSHSSTLSYRADPFVLTKNDKCVYFYEKYDYKLSKGQINSIEFDTATKQYTAEKEVLNPKEHLSYPFAFEYNGKRYCLPECFESNGVDLYEILEDNTLNRVCTLLEGMPVVDSTIVYHEGMFWLFCTLKNSLPNAQLYIFYSETLEGPYAPHTQNPVKTDVSSTRPAGTIFSYNGMLVRPAQNCSLTYGGSLVLNKIVTLTKDDYVEEKLTEVLPFDAEYTKGIHHLCVSGDELTVDGKKYIFSLKLLGQRLFSK